VQRLTPVLAASLAVLTLVGCAASPHARPRAGALSSASATGAAPAVTGTKGGPSVPGSTTGSSGGASAPGSTTATGPARSSGSGPRATPSGSPKPAPTGPTRKNILLSGVVTPKCVPAGSTATLTAHTIPNATLAYVAVYAGEKSGADSPFGYGYGGNDHGTSDANGDWTTTWVVSSKAPTGPARVTLVVNTNDGYNQVDVPFSVGAREVDGCGT
jgi:hypothetical protein